MKKILAHILIFTFAAFCLAENSANATTFGTYRQEYEYGLFDGIKFNFFNKKNGEKTIQLKEDIDKKIEKTEESKELQNKKDDDEYQMYKFMLDNTIPL